MTISKSWKFSYIALLLIELVFTNNAISQDSINLCDCRKQFEFTYQYIEANNPAFQVLKSDSVALKNYSVTKSTVSDKSKNVVNADSCYSLLTLYLTSIRDHHTCIIKNKLSNTGVKEDLTQFATFNAIDSKTSFLKIPSFSRTNLSQLNALYDTSLQKIMKYPNLIIDLRDNGGGSDAGWHRLLPLIYTNKFETDKVDFWASKDNISYYMKDSILSKLLYDKLRSQDINVFINLDKGRLSSFGLKKVKNPQRIVILQNKGVASSAEDFILYALQSKKVITLGENTGGYTGYGNVSTIYTPNKCFVLHTTTTKFTNGIKYEYAGIPPMYTISSEIDWIEFAMQYFK